MEESVLKHFGRNVSFRLALKLSENKLVIETRADGTDRVVTKSWVAGTSRRDFDCLACGKIIKKSSRLWHIAADTQTGVRIHEECMRRIAA